VGQAALAVHADVQLHAEVPLLALPGLVHLGVTRAFGVLGRAGRTDDGGVHDGAGLELEAALLQDLADLGEQLLAQLVLIEQPAELEHRGGVWYRLAPEVDAHEAAQAGAVVQRFFAGLVGQVEPVLDEVDAQHALQPDGRAATHAFRIVRRDHLAQRCPRHDGVHRCQELVAPRGPAISLEARTVIGRRRKGLLLHHCSTHHVSRRRTFSVNP
jgi:hypothetical protein